MLDQLTDNLPCLGIKKQRVVKVVMDAWLATAGLRGGQILEARTRTSPPRLNHPPRHQGKVKYERDSDQVASSKVHAGQTCQCSTSRAIHQPTANHQTLQGSQKLATASQGTQGRMSHEEVK